MKGQEVHANQAASIAMMTFDLVNAGSGGVSPNTFHVLEDE